MATLTYTEPDGSDVTVDVNDAAQVAAMLQQGFRLVPSPPPQLSSPESAQQAPETVQEPPTPAPGG